MEKNSPSTHSPLSHTTQRLQGSHLWLDAGVGEALGHVIRQLLVVLVDNRAQVDRTRRVRRHLGHEVERVHAPSANVDARKRSAATGGDLNDDVRIALLDQAHGLTELVHTHRGLLFLIASVNVKHRDSVLDALVHLIGHLLR